jgi:ABC-type multidrug transport system fused ATPase/permease subunit
MNHNSLYLVVLVYFVFLKTKQGKQYFNYLNTFLVFIYLITTITSLLTVVQSFSLNTVLSFAENTILLLYMIHTLFRDTLAWKEFRLNYSPFNEITNESYFYSLIVIVVFMLVVNLISTVVFSGLLLSCLDAVYVVLLGRYIYLYREYLDAHQLDSENEGNFDGVRKDIQEVLDSTTIDEKVVDAYEKVKEETKKVLPKKEKTTKEEKPKKKTTTKTTKKTTTKKTEKGEDK